MMHFYTMHELRKDSLLGKRIAHIAPEQGVLIDKKGQRAGKFDFLVRLEGNGLAGFEVLTRPTKGKLKAKLPYAQSVDEFIFVLPEGALDFYRKRAGKPFKVHARPKSFPAEFSDQKLRAWLFDVKARKFSEKGRFSEVFNTG